MLCTTDIMRKKREISSPCVYLSSITSGEQNAGKKYQKHKNNQYEIIRFIHTCTDILSLL